MCHHKHTRLLLPNRPGRVGQSVGHLTRKSEVLGSIPGLAILPLIQEGQLSVTGENICTKYRLGGLSLPRKSVVRFTDRPDMTLDVYRGRKITTQHNNNNNNQTGQLY